MPIEIRELVVKATIDPKKDAEEPRPEMKTRDKQKEQLVVQAAEQVFEMLRRRKER